MLGFCVFFIFTLFLKFLLSYYLPLLPDEAYYWVWSQHSQLSYFDHPGMIAWLFRLGHFLEPFGHSVRWPGVFINHLSYIFWYLTFKELKTPKTLFYSWAVLTILSPILGFGSILMTPDLPVMFFWSGSLYFFVCIVNSKKLWHYPLLGASLGLGFLSKYHIVLFPLIGIFYLTLEKKWKNIRPKGVLLTLLFGCIFSMPVFYWNYLNHFQSFKFQLQHGLESNDWKWQWPVEYLIGHFLMLLPFFVFYFFSSRLSGSQRILKYFSLGVLIFFMFTSFRSAVEMNWTILAYPTFYAVVLLSEMKPLWLRVTKLFFLGFNFVVILLMFNGIYIHGKIFEPFFFQKEKAAVTEFKPLYGINYQISSSLWYFSKQKILKLPLASRYDYFDSFPVDIKNFPSSFYVFKEESNEYPQWLLELKPKITTVKSLARNYQIQKVTWK